MTKKNHEKLPNMQRLKLKYLGSYCINNMYGKYSKVSNTSCLPKRYRQNREDLDQTASSEAA